MQVDKFVLRSIYSVMKIGSYVAGSTRDTVRIICYQWKIKLLRNNLQGESSEKGAEDLAEENPSTVDQIVAQN